MVRQQRVVPFGIAAVGMKVQLFHLGVSDLHSGLIAGRVEHRLDAQPLFRRGSADHIDHGLEADQRFSSPVHADE